ncbi:hypothetical protein J4416_00265 [Candidatus Pacearchaeota archaeon]|nr:hypothetical protein [Candidatus Pacearchaeota archaeon]
MKMARYKIGFTFLIAVALNMGVVLAATNFQVTSFSCSPSETTINSLFSCTATIQNTGDAAGTLSIATLYSDSGNWLEDSNYPQSYGQSVNPGNSISVTFSGLRATKSGNNGFSKIMLDSVTDTYVADNNKKVNVVNVVATIINSASSAVMGETVTTTAEVTAGGNIDVSLSFTSNSGGCSIGSQTNPKSISEMTEGSKQSRTWTITQGTTGNCEFTISATATGSGGVASKIDSTTSTITCTDCPVASSSSSSSSGSGGGGGGGGGVGSTGAVKTYIVGELKDSQIVIFFKGEKISFNVSEQAHTLTLVSHTNTSAVVEIESEKQTFTIEVNEKIEVDFNKDEEKDISVKLDKIDLSTNEISIILTRLSGADKIPLPEADKESNEIGKSISNKTKPKITILILLIVFGVITIISLLTYIIKRKKRKRLWGEK